MHTHIRTIVLVTVLSQTRSANGVEEGSTRGTGGDTRKSECVHQAQICSLRRGSEERRKYNRAKNEVWQVLLGGFANHELRLMLLQLA